MFGNYIFDLYGTLVDIRTDETGRILWKRLTDWYGMHGAFYSGAELRRRYLSLCAFEQGKRADEYYEIELRNVFKALFEERDVGASDDLVEETAIFFRVCSTKKLKVYPWVREAFDRIRSGGGGIFLLSNAQACFTVHELKKLGLAEAFDGIVLSSDAGVRKPDKRIMRLLLDKNGLDSRDCVMIGNDQHTDIAIAKAFGMNAVYVRTETSGEYDTTLAVEREVLDGDVHRLFELMEI